MRAALACLLSLTILVGTASKAAAERVIYRQIDRHGNVTWSDRPNGEAARPAAPRIIRLPDAPEESASDSILSAPGGPFVPYRQMVLVGPEDAISAARGRSGVAVRLSLSPGLQGGHRVQLKVNNRIAQSALAATFLMASDLAPGRHRLVAELVDAAGTVRQRSSPLLVDIRP